MTPFEKADEASRLLNNAVLNAAFADVRSNLINKLETVPIGDVDTQHEVALMLQLLRRVKDQLHNYINEQTILDHKEKQASFIDRMRRRA
jgi:hypothetical protein